MTRRDGKSRDAGAISQNSDALAKLAALNPLAEGAAPTQAAGVSIGVAALCVAAGGAATGV